MDALCIFVSLPKKRPTEHSAGRRRGSCSLRRPAGRRRSGKTCSPSASGWRRRRRLSTLPSAARTLGRRWWSFWASRRGRAPPYTPGRCTRSHARCLYAWLNELDVKPYKACTVLSDDLRPCAARGHAPGAWNHQLACTTGSTIAGLPHQCSPYGNSQVCSLCRCHSLSRSDDAGCPALNFTAAVNRRSRVQLPAGRLVWLKLFCKQSNGAKPAPLVASYPQGLLRYCSQLASKGPPYLSEENISRHEVPTCKVGLLLIKKS